ncbi:MAG: hypothetical protein PUC47_01225 [Oscillospiraceae bacterium]|nr:hypothetical protein [Oscillospiraceae bacterium]
MIKNLVNGPEIPMGFGMALAQNAQALEAFSRLSDLQQQQIIDGTHEIESKQQMQAYVQQLADGTLHTF